MAASGLDQSVLLGTYRALEDRGALFDWLDIDFQVSTLRRFFPDEVHALAREALLHFPEARAA